ncbi:hypothetical protein [Pelistega sp. MC2]|uniref:hypothetical protein n=1 Tax=Pelistega sp. MC2 TaxID=1720297 RepID=UPI0008DA166E|nr:hypothetical protein [Pelistega sp. MC2]
MDRRSFLQFGRSGVLPETPWDLFCHRLQRTVRGDFKRLDGLNEAYHAAQICIYRLADIQHIYALCREYEVAMVLDGFASPQTVHTRDLLMVQFSPSLNIIEELGEQACLAQPSVTAGQLLALGYYQFSRVPAEMTIAQWFASPLYHDCRPYFSFLSGVERINAIFADGSQAVVGGFGVDDRSALSVPILSRCIPNLFELLREDSVETQLASDYWPYSYRLDSLKKNLVDINIARFFQGHQGRIIWVQQWVIRKIPQDVLLLKAQLPEEECADSESIARINDRIKGLFDPTGIFLYDDEVIG